MIRGLVGFKKDRNTSFQLLLSNDTPQFWNFFFQIIIEFVSAEKKLLLKSEKGNSEHVQPWPCIQIKQKRKISMTQKQGLRFANSRYRIPIRHDIYAFEALWNPCFLLVWQQRNTTQNGHFRTIECSQKTTRCM